MRQFFRYILILLFIFGCGILHAQKEGKALVDSLTGELANAKQDTNRVNLLVALTNAFAGDNPDEGIKYGKEALALAEELNWQKGIANANLRTGNCYHSKSDYSKSLEYYHRALKMAEETGNKDIQGSCLSNIGLTYGDEKDLPRALEYDLRGLKIHEERGNKKNVAITLGNIGNLYMAMNDPAKALEYDLKAIKMYEEMGNKQGISRNLGNIGGIYQAQGNYAKAMEYYQQSLKMFEELNNRHGMAVNLGNIGVLYKLSADNPQNAVVKNRAQNLKQAIYYLNKGIELCKETGYLDGLQQFEGPLADAYYLSGDFKKALGAYKEYSAIKDTVFSNETYSEIASIEHKGEMDVKDKQIEIGKLEIAKKRTGQQFFIAAVILLLLITGVVLRRYFLKRRSNMLLEESNKLLAIEKRRSDELLLNILPAEVAEELKAKGSAAAKYFSEVTVLFTDFVGFTKASERMSPQELVRELDTCFKAFDDIITRNKIEKIKTLGDAYLAASGLPVPTSAHAVNVVGAALEIREFMAERRARLGDMTFEIRIGVNSGGVAAGIVGTKKFAYDIWGDTVNTAVKMEHNCQPGAVNISQATYEQVKDRFDCSHRGDITNDKGETAMYFVRGKR